MRYTKTKGADNYEKVDFDYHNIELDDINDAITLLRYAGHCVKKIFPRRESTPLYFTVMKQRY